MSFNIPDLLLSIPAPLVEHKYIEDGKLTLGIEQAEQLRKAYFEDVSLYLRSNNFSVENDIIPAVDFALRLFNAENFSGELSPAEREQYADVYKRFGAVVAAAEEDEGTATSCEPFFQRLLTADGEMPNACVRLSALLLCVLAITATREDGSTPLIPYTNMWRLRAYFRHQLCLMHRAHSIFLEISACIDALMMQPEDDITVEQLLEVGHVQNYYHRRELAAETLRRALKKSGLQIEEAAVMGVRTRWQQHQLVQMVLNAHSSRPIPESSTKEDQPVTIMAEKDGHDLLDRPRDMPDAQPLTVSGLHPEDKAIILALCVDIHNTNPFHGLTQHHVQTYVERLMADPSASPFMIRCQTLLTRARIETNRNRVQERAFMQMTELVDQFSSKRDPNQARFSRTTSDYFYAVAFPSIWALKSEFADFCFDETLFKTALDLYEQVLDWEKIIECCKKLDKRKRAESLARELLEKDPRNPMLWVALGEATREDEYLWKAWELSEHRMAAPMRSLARLALEREHYDKVVEYFDESVKINPIFGGDWFSLGYASLKLEMWERSGEAFTRVCQIDPYDAFAWNNLASIMLRKEKLRPAFNAMSQALRNNRRDWRMWQNYFRIGCQLKEVAETTNSLGIALDIAQRNIRLDRNSMEMFVNNTIAYLKGEIPGSSAEASETEGVKADTIRYKSMTQSASNEEEAVAHAAPAGRLGGENEEEEEEVLDGLVPLGADEDLTAEEVYAAAAAGAASNAAPAVGVHADILKRHGERVRALFLRILDMFVSDPDLYSCAAQYFAFTDGPMESYRFRVKELRACRQKDQWERNDELFDRTAECLESMAADAFAAFEVARDAMDKPAGCGQPAAMSSSSAADANEEEVSVEAQHDAIVDALKETQNNVKAVIEATEEYMESKEKYKALRALATRLRLAVQEAKATFV